MPFSLLTELIIFGFGIVCGFSISLLTALIFAVGLIVAATAGDFDEIFTAANAESKAM
jgi:hypothetical protein